MLDGLLHRDPGDGDQGAHVHAAEARVFPAVGGHVDQLRAHARCLDRGLDDRLGLTHEGEHGAVGGLPRVHIEEGHPVDGADGARDGLKDRGVTTLREVGDAFNELGHLG